MSLLLSALSGVHGHRSFPIRTVRFLRAPSLSIASEWSIIFNHGNASSRCAFSRSPDARSNSQSQKPKNEKSAWRGI